MDGHTQLPGRACARARTRRGSAAIEMVLLMPFCLFFAAAIVYGGFNEAWQKLMRWETFGTAWDPPIPATMKPLLLVTVSLVALQAVANLISDWNKEPEIHTPADEV